MLIKKKKKKERKENQYLYNVIWFSIIRRLVCAFTNIILIMYTKQQIHMKWKKKSIEHYNNFYKVYVHE